MRLGNVILAFAFITLMFLPEITWGENPDSLQLVLNSEASDTQKVKACRELFLYYEFKDTSEAKLYLNKGLEISAPLADQEWAASIWNLFGWYYDDRSDFARAIQSYEEALSIRREAKYGWGIAKTLSNLGIVYYRQGNYFKAHRLYLEALEYVDPKTDPEIVSRLYNSLGEIYRLIDEESKALEYFGKALKMFRAMGEEGPEATILSNMGVIFDNGAEVDSALFYYTKALRIRERINDEFNLATSYNNVGTWHTFKGDPDSALVYHNRALELRLAQGDRTGLAMSYYNLGFTFIALEDFDKALDYCQQSLEVAEEIQSLYHVIEGCECMGAVYEEIGDFEKALEYQKKFQTHTDSMKTVSGVIGIAQREAKFEFEQAAIADSVALAQEMMAADAALQRRNQLQYSGIIVFILLLGAIVGLQGRLKVSERLTQGLTFLGFILLFEFLLVILDPWIESVAEGAVLIKLLINTGLGVGIFFAHQFFDRLLKRRNA